MTDPETAAQNVAASVKSTLKEAVDILEAASDAVDAAGPAPTTSATCWPR